MSVVFAGTFYWIAVTNVQDTGRDRAKGFTLPATPGAICTTHEVLAEYLNYFAAWGPGFRLKASNNVQNIVESETVRVVTQTPASFMSGLEMYRTRLDKGYSLTDCISMQTMRRDGLIDVITNDRHFEQEGFRAVFRDGH